MVLRVIVFFFQMRCLTAVVGIAATARGNGGGRWLVFYSGTFIPFSFFFFLFRDECGNIRTLPTTILCSGSSSQALSGAYRAASSGTAQIHRSDCSPTDSATLRANACLQ